MSSAKSVWWKSFSSDVCQRTRQTFLPYIHSSHHTSGPYTKTVDGCRWKTSSGFLSCVLFYFQPSYESTQCQANTSKQIKSDAIRQSGDLRATGRSTASSFGPSTSSPFVRSTSVDAAHSNKSANLPQLSHFLFERFWQIVLKTAHESQGGNCLLLPCSHSERELKPQTLDAPFQQFNRVFNHNQHQKKKIIGCCSAKTKLPEDQASAEVLRF